jgi:hypothetical protein
MFLSTMLRKLALYTKTKTGKKFDAKAQSIIDNKARTESAVEGLKKAEAVYAGVKAKEMAKLGEQRTALNNL